MIYEGTDSMALLVDLLQVLLGVVIGAVIGFFLARKYMKKMLSCKNNNSFRSLRNEDNDSIKKIKY